MSQTLQHRRFLHDGMAFSYQVAGQGPYLVMLHGGGSRASHFHRVMLKLANDFTVVAYDQRGFGDTGLRPGAHVDHQIWADDLLALLDHLKIDRAALLGWSLGATVALNVASQQPTRILGLILMGASHPDRPIDHAFFRRRLALVEAGACAADVVEETFAHVAAMLSPWSRAHRPEALEQVREEQLGNRVELVKPLVAAYESRPDLAALLTQIACPVFVIAGDADVSGLRAAEGLVERLPKCRSALIENCGHYYGVEQPDAAARAIAAGLRWAIAQ